MDSALRSETHSLIALLGLPPDRVDPFQLLRWIERRGAALFDEERERREAEGGRGAPAPRMARLGEGAEPRDELVRFRVAPTLRFPAAAITRAEARLDVDEADRLERLVWDVEVTFCGLIGSQGVLPQHYTSTCLRREQSRDGALLDLLDLLHQRLVAFFYRAWRKYHLAAAAEVERRAGVAGPGGTLRALAGTATPAAAAATGLDDDATAALAGYLGREVVSAPAIEAAIGALAGCPTSVESFVGRWVPVRAADRGVLGGEPQEDARGLGQGQVLGATAYVADARCRLHLGPLPFAALTHLRPDGAFYGRLARTAARLAGPAVEVEVVQHVARADARPPVLGGDGTGSGRLGWSAWLVDPAVEGAALVGVLGTLRPGEFDPAAAGVQ